MDEKRRAEVLWAFCISREKIFKQRCKRRKYRRNKTAVAWNLKESDIEKFAADGSFDTILHTFLYPKTSTEEFVSLTDIAREINPKNPSYVIQGWLRNKNTIHFFKLWELENNPNFLNDECNKIIGMIKQPSFTITAKQWINQTNAAGIISKQGNAGGTLAHHDIAIDFQLWLFPEKRFEIVKAIRDLTKYNIWYERVKRENGIFV